MDKKDLLGLELKSIMEEDTRDMLLSQASINQILESERNTFLFKIKSFLNREIEIPLAPAIVGLAAFLFITSVPTKLFKYESKEIMFMDSSPIVLSSREVVSK